MDCTTCGEPLNEAIVLKDEPADAIIFKSCPRCSVDASRHVFYEEEAFGYRTLSVSGRTYVQSYCTACRTDGEHPQPYGYC